MGWKQVASNAEGRKILSTMTMEESGLLGSTDTSDFLPKTDVNVTKAQEDLLFKREVRFFFSSTFLCVTNIPCEAVFAAKLIAYMLISWWFN